MHMRHPREAIWADAVQNRYINHALGRLIPERSFLTVNRWPESGFTWTTKGLVVMISFDCDTDEDARAFPRLLELLAKYSIRASFAVIGALVEKEPAAYQALVRAGHEVFCHGYHYHTQIKDGLYQTDLFYDRLTWDEIESEIIASRRAVEEAVGVEPQGFRVPHFGTFQTPDRIGRLYELLIKHGFAYSSSLLMWNAKRQNRCGNTGFWEFPLSARVGPPISLIDSWNMVIRDRSRGRHPRLETEWRRALEVMLKADAPVFLNAYFDPAHINNYEPFETMLSMVADVQDVVWCGTYSDIVRRAN